jgi:hypothetical protein
VTTAALAWPALAIRTLLVATTTPGLLVRDTPIAQFVLYRLRRNAGVAGRLLSSILDAVIQDDAGMRDERDRAAHRSRSLTHARVQEPQAIRALTRAKRPS